MIFCCQYARLPFFCLEPKAGTVLKEHEEASNSFRLNPHFSKTGHTKL